MSHYIVDYNPDDDQPKRDDEPDGLNAYAGARLYDPDPQPEHDAGDASGQVHEGPGEHDRAVFAVTNADLVPCPVCRRSLNAEAKSCHHCQSDFQKEVWRINDSRRGLWWGGLLKFAVVLLLLTSMAWGIRYGGWVG